MTQKKYWAEVDENNVCFNIVWTSLNTTDIQDNWVSFTPSEGVSGDIIGKEYKDGIWVDIKTYAEKRKARYDSLNQFEMQYDDAVNGTTTWQDAINAIKQEIPKGGN